MLTVENPYLAVVKLKKLKKYLPVGGKNVSDNMKDIKPYLWTNDVEYDPVYKIGKDMAESIKMMNEAAGIESHLPGLDCGACGAPTCKALSEDIVKGLAQELDCINLFREYANKGVNNP